MSYGSFLSVCEALPDYVKDPVAFLYHSGGRISEMRALEWRDVDLPGKVIRLRPELSKNKDERLLPLNGELLALIRGVSAQRRLDCIFVFHIAGQKIGSFRKALKTACKVAELVGTIPHDLRRCAVRNLLRTGVAERIAMTLSGHKTQNIFDRYNIVSEADLLQAAELVQTHRAAQPTEATVVPVKAAG